MKLIVILICLGLDRYLAWGSKLAELKWLEYYLTFMQDRLRGTPVGKGVLKLVANIGALSVLVGLVSLLMSGWILGAFLLNIALLMFCLGKPVSQTRSLKGFVTSFYEQYFGVVFWYMVLGPFGAFAYRLSILSAEQSASNEKEILDQWIGWIDWLPIRVQGFFYALGGNFATTFGYWLEHFLSSPKENHALLVNCGARALGSEETSSLNEEQQENMSQLSDRTLMLLLAALLLVIIGRFLA